MKRKMILKARTLDRKFDRGEEIIDQLDLKRARRVGADPKLFPLSPKTDDLEK